MMKDRQGSTKKVTVMPARQIAVGSAFGLRQKQRMPHRLSLTSILVDEYDEAISFYVEKLGLELRQDTRLSEDKRWVVVAPRGAEPGLLLARAADDRQRKAIGDQCGGEYSSFSKQMTSPEIIPRTSAEALFSSRNRVMKTTALWPYLKTFAETGGI